MSGDFWILLEMTWPVAGHPVNIIWPEEKLEALTEMMMIANQLAERDQISGCKAFAIMLEAKFGSDKFPDNHQCNPGIGPCKPSRLTCTPCDDGAIIDGGEG